ncbi:hypothetical protein [Spirosoma radiotolerans]|uniref:Uncharacterized protein n=1 Tax=Spirosoma radiotolerans TaxID=1379870 RepID=A0A0E3ZVM0_9BACT|nr:hypothetical protein [Spirosoma radiotolerans]AKD56214.1 hypothetical protein SD10_16235 [Spirosoma radiotolerans]
MTPAERAMQLRNTPTPAATPASASRPAPSAAQVQTAAAMSNGYWAAKKTLSDGREARYWQGEKNGRNTRAAGWYVRGISGGWEDSTTRISSGPLNTSEPGVVQLPRIASLFTPNHELRVIDDTWDFTAQLTGRERSQQAVRGRPHQLQTDNFNKVGAWCDSIDALMELFEQNEQDVKKWRNGMATLSGLQIGLGILGGGLIVAGIVASGGLAAIPMAAGAIAIGVSSAATGVAVGAARSVTEVGLANAQREGGVQSGRAAVGGGELLKGSGAVGAKEGITRTLVEVSHAGAASAVGAVAGGGGAAISIVKGGMGAYKAYKVDVGAIWAQVEWDKVQQNIADAETFVEKNKKGFDPEKLAALKQKLEDTNSRVAKVRRLRWADESRRK